MGPILDIGRKTIIIHYAAVSVCVKQPEASLTVTIYCVVAGLMMSVEL
ncbi:MAG: hypothetical protein R2831_02935 [Chitinophagaceae bacterium]